VAQLVLQAVAPQAKGAQAAAAGALQVPVPVQVPVEVALPEAQAAVPQTVEVLGYVQIAETPLQPPAQVPVPLQVRVPTGAPVTMLQLPSLPGALQAWQAAVQPASQQTPSTQKPE
jgi:hypothetical protein